MGENFIQIIEIVIPVLTIIFGALSLYFKENEKLRNNAEIYISKAEELYKDTTKSGGQKFTWVVDTLYDIVPSQLKFIITKQTVEKIVQNTFDNIEAYSKIQLDKTLQELTQKTGNNE